MVELVETALLLECPDTDPVVGPSRARLMRASRVGIPAHVTVIYPFVPFPALRRDDLDSIGEVAASVPAFTMTFSHTDWYGDEAVFLVPDDPGPVRSLVEAAVVTFPEHPPYGGLYDDPVPHLTIGHDHPVAELKVAERAVCDRLPISQEVTELRLWAGPPLMSEQPGWRRVGSYPLDGAAD